MTTKQLRDDTFQCLTNDDGNCWKCGGPVAGYFNHEAFESHRYPAVCFVRITDDGFLRDCAKVSPQFCGRDEAPILPGLRDNFVGRDLSGFLR